MTLVIAKLTKKKKKIDTCDTSQPVQLFHLPNKISHCIRAIKKFVTKDKRILSNFLPSEITRASETTFTEPRSLAARGIIASRVTSRRAHSHIR